VEQLPRRHCWLPSPAFLVFVGVVVIVLLVLLPGLRSASRASNEREASTMLKTITSAEADFRANDRDHNKVEDYWTGDVSGLFYVKPADGGPEVRLIMVDLANADAQPLFPPPPDRGPRQGFRFQALDRDDSVGGEKGIYRVDTDRSGRKVHNLARFGFVAFPADDGQGKYVFFTNEMNTVFHSNSTQPRATFPSDEELKQITGY
jgi:hypothetical protein